uniref:Uncharacterized protein n=1 Tax=Morchella brunnea TaxID=1174671 RepID=A0A8K1I7W0_9PEZI|nr:hypothetical protein LK370_mgp102 [Morchella brunnea]UBU98558.1 hypothetical protein [Morchella brunnea]
MIYYLQAPFSISPILSQVYSQNSDPFSTQRANTYMVDGYIKKSIITISAENYLEDQSVERPSLSLSAFAPQSIRTMLIVEWIGGEWEAASLSLLPTFHNYTSSCEKWGGEAERGDAF